MAKFKEDCQLKFITTKDGDEEEASFSSGDEIYVVKEWDRHYLVRDDDGHYYNVEKSKIEA